MNTSKDYIKIDDKRKTRVNLSIYELAGLFTTMSKAIFDEPDLSKYLNSSDTTINRIINPAEIGVRLLLNHTYDAILDRNGEHVKFSDTYVNPHNIELVTNNFDQKNKIIKACIDDQLKEVQHAPSNI